MTDSNNLDNAISYLGSSLKNLVESAQQPIDYKSLPSRIPKRSLSGDHIYGGKILNFSSSGILDEAKDTQISISTDGVLIKTLNVEKVKGDLTVENTIHSKDLSVSGTVKATRLEVEELATDLRFQKSASLEFKVAKGEKLQGKGLLWIGEGHTKQFVLSSGDKFFSSESIDLYKEKHFSINGTPVLTSTELGSSITNSNLKKVGTLQGLSVNGDVGIDQYIFYNSVTSRLGLGTAEPNAGFSVAEDGVEIIIGTKENSKGVIGTFASNRFDIVTDNTSRISIAARGDIDLGNFNSFPIQVKVNGKMSIGVKTADERVDLHVAGAIKFNERIHQYADTSPQQGNYSRGDIVWNNNPELGKSVGWVCVKSGSPGMWLPFGEIKPLIK